MRMRFTGRWVGALIVLGWLLVGQTRVASAQGAPPKQKPADTTKKTPAKPASHLVVHKDVVQQASAAGEVCLPLRCGIDDDSVARAVSKAVADEHERDLWAWDAQRRLDSIKTRTQVQGVIDRFRTEAAAQRERARIDSIAKANETAAAAELARQRLLARGWYVGIAGGASAPQNELRDGYGDGFNATIPLGWDADELPFGFRTDLSVDRMFGARYLGQSGAATAAGGDITVWSLNADLKLRAHAPGAPSRTNVYALGGIGMHRVIDGVFGAFGTSAGQSLSFGDAKTSFGWNIGAGISTAWGPTELFAETRLVDVKSDLSYHPGGGVGTHTMFVPIVVGLSWF